MNDLHIGRIARALRHRLLLRQLDVADRVDVGHDVVSRVERGRLAGIRLGTLRSVFMAFDAEVVVLIKWRGGELDRLLDRRHASLAERLVHRLEQLGWAIAPEVSFSEYGERGSIDILAWHAATRTLLVVELKTELTSIEETVRRHDVKTRLGRTIAHDRFGWEAREVSRLLVLPEERTPRRQVERFANVLGRAYPMRGREARDWLAAPAGTTSGLVFLTGADGLRLRQRVGPTRRISGRRTHSSVAKVAADADGSGE